MATAAPRYRIEIGNVISMGFRTLGRNFLPFLAFALLLAGLPTFVVHYLFWEQLDAQEIPYLSLVYLLTWAVSWITGYLLQAIIVRSAVLDLSGRSPDAGGSALTALRMLFPMIGLSVVSGIAIGFGLLLLIVPGIILMLMWSVAVPALVEERRGVFESLSRSAELTSGSKGWVLVLLLLYWGVSWMVSIAVGALTGFQMATLEAGSTTIVVVASALAQTFSSLLLAAMLAALYIELRQFKEGASTDQLAAIFE